MKQIAWILLVLLSFAIAGCKSDVAPLASGTVVDGGLLLGQYTLAEKGKKPKSWSLSSQQLQKLTLWLKSHQDGWQMILATPPPPSYSVLLIHTDSMRSQLDLYSINESWQRAIRWTSWDRDGKWLDSGMQQLSGKDIADLKQVLADEK